MIKECKVILQNSELFVVNFDDKQIQFPYTLDVGKTVFVKYEDGKYSIVKKNEKKVSQKQPCKKVEIPEKDLKSSKIEVTKTKTEKANDNL